MSDLIFLAWSLMLLPSVACLKTPSCICFTLIFVMSCQEWSPYVDQVNFVTMKELYLIYHKTLVRKLNPFPMLLMFLSFSSLLPMVKSTLFLSLIWVPSSPTLLLIRIQSFYSLNENLLAIAKFHMQIDIG